MLTYLGHTVEIVPDGKQALDAFQRQSFDVVFLDCQMPLLDGFATARELRSRLGGQPLPILALTAHAFEGDRDRALAAGMDDPLPKPVTIQALQDAFDRWLPAAEAD